MNLETLIQELETADGLATGGEWEPEKYDDPRRVDRFITAPNDLWVVQAAMPSNAQAIAIRHNRAAEVIRRLKWLKAKDELNIECTKAYVACFAKIEEVIRGVHFDPDAGEFATVRTSELKALYAQLESPTPTAPAKLDEETP